MTIYVITHHQFNHEKIPLDDRFLNGCGNYVYYLIDKTTPSPLQKKSVLFESEIDPVLAKAGKEYFGEWAFLLAEAKHGFCQYPFFMISSRFYQKNTWLLRDLNTEWETLFSYLDDYGWGCLPCYDRPLRWIELEWKKKLRQHYWKHRFFPFKEEAFHLIQNLYQVKIFEEYRATIDLLCNYIGFKSRAHLLEYVNFYRPLIYTVFNEDLEPKTPLDRYVRKTDHHRNEKPFTFLLERFSHLFFYKEAKKFYTLHYDGYYEVDEKERSLKMLKPFQIPLQMRLERFFEWNLRKAKTEGFLAPFLPSLRILRGKIGI